MTKDFNKKLVAGLPDANFWLEILNDFDKKEDNYQRKMRAHKILSLDSIINDNDDTLIDLIPADALDPEKAFFDKYIIKSLIKALNTLSEKDRAIIASFYSQSKKKPSRHKVAKNFGIDDGTVKRHIEKALIKLHKELKNKI